MSEASPQQDPGNTNSSPRFGLGDQAHFQQREKRSNVVLWGIFALLLILTLGVFFLLPRYVSAPDPATTTVKVLTPAAAPNAPGLSPFEEAQRLRQREGAQNTLAAFLELQEALEAQQVKVWAQTDFTSAIAFAQAGDSAYREQRYVDANTEYQSGLNLLQTLDASKPQVYTRYLSEGDTALAQGKASAADQAYSIALLVNPDSSDAVTGMERAHVLDQVLMLLEAGHNLESGQQLEAAREQYRQAQKLDPNNPEASQAITAINRAIVERDFAAAMSRGFAALQANDPQAARTAFNQAAALKPNSAEVAAALQQAADQQTFTAVTVHINQGQQQEAEENWAAALNAWNQALVVDPNLVSALEGKRRSESRNNLDSYLVAILNDPLRLTDDSVFNQTQQVLVDAKRIPAPGPKLQDQIRQIEQFLGQVKVPATVQFQSDGLTTVTLYKVGELGIFSTHNLSLLPGQYVAVGVRPGYRDVRQEFTVPLEGTPPLVLVSCSELI